MRPLLFVFALGAAACSGTGFYAVGESSPKKDAGVIPAASFLYSRDAAALDDVTNGLQADPAAEDPLSGAFFDGGSDGDVRARSDNLFAKDSAGMEPGAPAERMLIHNGSVRVEVPKPDEAIAAFLLRVEGWGGYMQSQVDDAVVVRLPAAHFDEAFAALHDAGRVLYEHRKADDVTEEFVDLGIRIDNARKSRDRLLEVLKQAEKVEDVLAVEKELRRLTEEIERMEGRRKFLADRVAMATLQAEFRGIAEAPPPPKRARRPSRFGWINAVGAEQVMRGF